MEKTVISFSVENWITIMVMVVLGYGALAVALRVAHKVAAKSNA